MAIEKIVRISPHIEEETSQAITPKPSLIDKLGSGFRKWSINPKEIVNSLGTSAVGLWSSLREIPGRLVEPPKNFFLRNTIQTVVDFQHAQELDSEIQYQMVYGKKVPILVTNHQQHIDGFVFAVIGKHIKRLVAAMWFTPPFAGFIAPGAKSWDEGHQGGDLKAGLDVFRKPGEQLGVEIAMATRKKDKKYGMKISLAEARPIIRGLHLGKGFAILPEGSWKSGRHPRGAGVEEIYGMQPFVVDMAEWIQIVERETDKEPFIIVAGINGSYRCVWNGEDEKGEPENPKITPEGWRGLILGMFGLRIGYRRIEAKLQSVITLAKLEAAVGPNWRENGEAVNNYLAEQIEEAIPEYARRPHKRSVNTQTIELSKAS